MNIKEEILFDSGIKKSNSEKKTISTSLSIKEQIQYESGLDDGLLTEGIRFFKNSKRIEKLIQKFQGALGFAKDNDTKRDVNEYIRELQKAKLDFEGVEQKFATGNKVEAKEEYKMLRIKFSKIISDINQESLKKFMVVGGLVALVFTTFALIISTHSPVEVSPKMINGVPTGMPQMATRDFLSANEKAIRAEIKKNNDLLRMTKDKIGALNLFEKNQKLIEKLAAEQERAVIKLQGS